MKDDQGLGPRNTTATASSLRFEAVKLLRFFRSKLLQIRGMAAFASPSETKKVNSTGHFDCPRINRTRQGRHLPEVQVFERRSGRENREESVWKHLRLNPEQF